MLDGDKHIVCQMTIRKERMQEWGKSCNFRGDKSEDPAEKMNRPEGGEEATPADIWEKHIPGQSRTETCVVQAASVAGQRE